MADKTVGALVNHVVMPGDVIRNVADLEAALEGKSKIKFGPGLREENGVILAYKAGVLRHRNPATYLIDGNQRRVRKFKASLASGFLAMFDNLRRFGGVTSENPASIS